MIRAIFVFLCLLPAVFLSGGLLAQPAKTPRIGVLGLAGGPGWQEQELLRGLRELNYIDGQNIVIEYRGPRAK